MQKSVQNLIAKTIGVYINLWSYISPAKSLSLAYGLFSQPRKGKLNPQKLPKTLLKAEMQSHFLNQKQFYTYHWKGNNEVILLVHGWESNSARWKKTLPYLQKTGKTIIAIDAPAHGLTSGKQFNVPDYAELINEIAQKYQPKIAIGHSIGGNALAYFQHKYDHNLQKMILLGAPSDFKIILQNFINILGLNTRVHQQLINYTKKRFNLSIEEFSATNFLEKTSIPGIIAHDTNDNVVQFEEAKKMANSWKTAQFIATNGLGHSMHDAKLYQTLLDFLES